MCVAEADRLLDLVAGAMVLAAEAAVEARGEFHVALSGGTTPEPLYMRLVIDPRYRLWPWERTHVWVVDERRVPHNDERSNWRLIHEALVAHVPVRARHLHPMPVEGEDPAMAYEGQLQRHLPGGRLDFVLLGMGTDGHTASLFPHTPAASEAERWVAVSEGPTVVPPSRVTMTYPLLNASREVAVLVTGQKKAATWRRVEAGGSSAAELPVLGVLPTDGGLTWFVDEVAAGGTL